MADLSPYKQAIANAYEGRAVRDALVDMVQAVQDAINSAQSGLDTRVTTLETSVSTMEFDVSQLDSGLEGLGETVQGMGTALEGIAEFDEAVDTILRGEDGRGGLCHAVEDLDQRVTALEGG